MNDVELKVLDDAVRMMDEIPEDKYGERALYFIDKLARALRSSRELPLTVEDVFDILRDAAYGASNRAV